MGLGENPTATAGGAFRSCTAGSQDESRYCAIRKQRPYQKQIQRQHQRRPPEGGRYKFKGKLDAKEPARRRRYPSLARRGIEGSIAL